MSEWKVTFETPAFKKSLSPVRTQFFHKVKVIFKALVLLFFFFTSLQNLPATLTSLAVAVVRLISNLSFVRGRAISRGMCRTCILRTFNRL